MPDVNDPNGARDNIPVAVTEETTGGYGWLPFIVVAGLVIAIFMMLPTGSDEQTRTAVQQDKPAVTTPVKPAPPAQ